jgi:hypothetical protein
VDEAVLLQKFLADRHLEHRLSLGEGGELRPEHRVEGLGVQHSLGVFEELVHGTASHFLSGYKSWNTPSTLATRGYETGADLATIL